MKALDPMHCTMHEEGGHFLYRGSNKLCLLFNRMNRSKCVALK